MGTTFQLVSAPLLVRVEATRRSSDRRPVPIRPSVMQIMIRKMRMGQRVRVPAFPANRGVTTGLAAATFGAKIRAQIGRSALDTRTAFPKDKASQSSAACPVIEGSRPRCRTVAAQGPGQRSGSSFLVRIFPAKHRIFGVEPMGLEPLASAVQRRHDSLPELSRVCTTPANRCICSSALFSRFQAIHSGCCTVAAQQVSEHC